jgi:hypothetical protein
MPQFGASLMTVMRGNQLPVSVDRWQHGSQTNFNLVKNQKNVKNSTTTKGREKVSTDLESLQF